MHYEFRHKLHSITIQASTMFLSNAGTDSIQSSDPANPHPFTVTELENDDIILNALTWQQALKGKACKCHTQYFKCHTQYFKNIFRDK